MKTSLDDVQGRSDLAEAVKACPKLSDLPPFEQVRWVAKHHQAARVRGLFLDATSANMILQVHACLSPRNQAKIEGMPIRAMFETVCAILGKVRAQDSN
jgi:hypothetical protein